MEPLAGRTSLEEEHPLVISQRGPQQLGAANGFTSSAVPWVPIALFPQVLLKQIADTIYWV